MREVNTRELVEFLVDFSKRGWIPEIAKKFLFAAKELEATIPVPVEEWEVDHGEMVLGRERGEKKFVEMVWDKFRWTNDEGSCTFHPVEILPILTVPEGGEV